MQPSKRVVACLLVVPLLILGHFMFHVLPFGQSSAFRSSPASELSHELRCRASRLVAVNRGRNFYSMKPFHTISAVRVDSSQHMTSFIATFNPPPCFRVLAIMAGFNEADVLHSSISDLMNQNIDVHFIDNWSTDGTFNVVRRLQRQYPGRISLERFPEQDDKLYNWAAILQRKTQLAMRAEADWVVHIDPDELRESPWGAEISLRRALYVASELDYNLVNFGNVLVFQPLNSTNFSRKSSLRDSFLHYSTNKFSGDSKQSKAWKTYYSTCLKRHLLHRQVAPDLSASGGHILQYVHSEEYSFPGHKLFPLTFFLRHYPIRSQDHGARKVFSERHGRWNVSERNSLDWHKQYDTVHQGHNFLKEERELARVHDNGDLPAGLLTSFLPCRPDTGHNT
jgi:glycosyltransferase involved in cell wall biosynthesis